MTRIPRRLTATLAASALVALASCGSGEEAGAPSDDGTTSITAASQPNTTGFPIWLAQKLGYYEDEKLDVSIKYYASGPPEIEGGLAGDWQAGYVGAPPALTADKWGLLTAGVEINEGRNQIMMMRKKDLAGKSPAEALRGGSALVAVNTTSEQTLFACLDHLGVPVDEVQEIPTDPAAVVQSFTTGQGTAAMTWTEPALELLDNPDLTQVCDGEEAGVDIYSVYVVTPKFWEVNPDGAAAWLRAVYRANDFIVHHREKALDHLLEYFKEIGFDGDRADAEIDLDIRDWIGLDKSIAWYQDGTAAKALGATADFLVDKGAFESRPDIDAIVEKGLEVAQRAADGQ